MIRVLHVMARMAPSGTELQLAGTLRAARGGVWQPTLCVLYPGFALAAQLRADGVEVVEIGGTGRVHVDRFARLRALARSGRFDVVHTSLWGAGAFGRAAILGPHRPAVVMSERRVEQFRGRGRRAVDHVLARATDAWIGNSQDVVDFVVQAHGAPAARVHLVPNGIDTDVFRPGPPGQPGGPGQSGGPGQPGGPGQSGSPVRIGALGRLVHQKGFDVLLEALRRIVPDRDVELVVAGEGELRDELTRQADRLPATFPGALDGGAAVAQFLRGLDLFVMPSRYEGLPNAVLEALACGVPVVATDVAGMRAAVGPDVALVPADDPAALASAMLAELGAGPRRRAGPGWARSFADVAEDHRRVFQLAVEHNAAKRRG